MRIILRILLVLFIIYAQLLFSPTLHLGLIIAIYFLLFTQSEEGYIFALMSGILIDLIFPGAGSISLVLLYVLVLGVIEFISRRMTIIEFRFRDYFLMTALGIGLLEIPFLIYGFSFSASIIFFKALLTHLIIATLLFVLIRRVKLSTQLSSRPLLSS